MARVTSNDWFNADTFDDEDEPGAGPQTFDSAGENGTGVNGFRVRTWKAVTSFFSGYGVPKNDVVDGAHLKSSVADGVTLETTAGTGTKWLRIKAGGVGTGQLADGAVTEQKLADNATTTNKINDGSVTESKLADSAVTQTKIADDAVIPSKISHDNNRTKAIFTCSIETSGGSDYASFHGTTLSNARGIPMPRSGSITKVMCSANGVLSTATAAYGVNTFPANSQITVWWGDGGDGVVVQVIGGSVYFAGVMNVGGTIPMLITIEVEFDD